MTKSDARVISAREPSALLPSWRLHLEAASISARTIQAYTDDGALPVAYLARQGMPSTARSLRRKQAHGTVQPVLLARRQSSGDMP
jgi:hypothetical protein